MSIGIPIKGLMTANMTVPHCLKKFEIQFHNPIKKLLVLFQAEIVVPDISFHIFLKKLLIAPQFLTIRKAAAAKLKQT